MHRILGKNNFYIRLESLSIGVTGSCNYLIFHLPDGREERLLIDCGLFMEMEESELNRKFSFNCKKILAVLVTHEHSDHCGRIPCLYANGFKGKVYGSEYAIQKIKTDAMRNYFMMRRCYSPSLYEEKDATALIENSEVLGIDVEYELTQNIFVTPLANAHTKGAVMYLIRFSYEGNEIRALFTGDYKKRNISKRSHFPMADEKYQLPITIVTEATHGGKRQPQKIFQAEVKKAILENRSILVVAHGETRYETIAHEIKTMQKSGELSKKIPVFIDFKKKFDTTGIDKEILPDNVIFIQEAVQRQYALYERGPKIVIATNRGVTDYWIREVIENSKWLIFYTNYVSKNSRAERMIRKPPGASIELAHKLFVKMAEIKNTSEYSDHDYLEGLINLLQGFETINAIFLEHGEGVDKEKLKREILKKMPGEKVITLRRGKTHKIWINKVI